MLTEKSSGGRKGSRGENKMEESEFRGNGSLISVKDIEVPGSLSHGFSATSFSNSFTVFTISSEDFTPR